MDNPMSHDSQPNMNLLEAILKTKYSVFLSMLIMAAFLLGLFLFFHITVAGTQTFQHAVRFTFLEKAPEDKVQGSSYYPNGLKFSIADLTAPLVLQKVYEDNHLADKNIKLEDFVLAVSVTPYASLYNQVLTRYENRLADKKLAFTERQTIENNLALEMNNMSKNNALISLHYSNRLDISSAIGRKLVTDIPKTWSEISIQKRGVLKLPQEQGNRALIDDKILTNYDSPVILDIFNRNINIITSRLQKFGQLDGAKTIIDNKSKYTLLSLKQAITNLKKYQLRRLVISSKQNIISQNKDFTKNYLQERIDEDNMALTSIEERIAVLDDILYNRKSNFNQGSIQRQNNTKSQADVVPQVNEGFIQKIQDMTIKGLNLPLQKDLITKKLKLQKRLPALKYTIANLKKTLDSLENNDGNSLNNIQNVKHFNQQTEAIRLKINEYWAISNNLFQKLSTNRFSYNSNLYTDLSLKKNVVNYHPARTSKMYGLYFLALLFAALIGMFLSLLRQFMQRS